MALIDFEIVAPPQTLTAATIRSLPNWNPIFKSGFEDECLEDSDTDRLPNCHETDTGAYTSTTNTGTSRNNPDTDGDGLIDGDEVLTTATGLSLLALGARPVHKDILIEYDWFDDAQGCPAHSHRPTTQLLTNVAAVFSSAEVPNPDGTIGINVIQDIGQGGLLIGGNLIVDADGDITDGLSTQFYKYKSTNFSTNRSGYFHYVILTHYLRLGPYSYTGLGELPGDDFVVGLHCYYSDPWAVASTVVHELGHNLNLDHGGNTACNFKPNYVSVMNYAYSGNGDIDCDWQGDGALNYSYGDRRPLNESNLNENLGMCFSPIVPIDWNGNGTLEASISRDLNPAEDFQDVLCGGVLSTLYDHDDWGSLLLAGVRFGSPPTVGMGSTTSTTVLCNSL